MANSADGTVSVISASSNAVVATVTVGAKPFGEAYDSGKGEIFVTNENSDSVSVLSDSSSTSASPSPATSASPTPVASATPRPSPTAKPTSTPTQTTVPSSTQNLCSRSGFQSQRTRLRQSAFLH